MNIAVLCNSYVCAKEAFDCNANEAFVIVEDAKEAFDFFDPVSEVTDLVWLPFPFQ